MTGAGLEIGRVLRADLHRKRAPGPEPAASTGRRFPLFRCPDGPRRLALGAGGGQGPA
jgi:hypothetical protein